MDIGAHTLSHPILSCCDEAEAREEIMRCRTELENALGRDIWAFAYPFGTPATVGVREMSLAREAGFSCAFMNVGGGGADRAQPFAIARTHVPRDMSPSEFEAHLTGLHTRLQRVFRA